MAPPTPDRLARPPEPSQARFTLHDAGAYFKPPPWQTADPVALPEVLDRRFGKVWRVVAIPLGALSIALLALALIAIALNLGMLV